MIEVLISLGGLWFFSGINFSLLFQYVVEAKLLNRDMRLQAEPDAMGGFGGLVVETCTID